MTLLPNAGLFFRIECASACAVFGNVTFHCQLFQMALHGGGTQTGAQLKNFLLGELTNLIPDGVFDGIEGCGTEDLDTIIEVAVCGDNGAEQVFHERGGIVLLLMPANLCILQRGIVCILIFGNLGFQGDILANLIVGTVQQ